MFYYFFIIINIEYKINPMVIKYNNKIIIQKPVIMEYLKGKGVRVKPLTPYTQD